MSKDKNLAAESETVAQLNLADPTLFGNDAAEEEDPAILASYFVNQADFSEFLSTERKLQFARSRKGMGKSALLAKLGYDLAQKSVEILSISLTGADLTALGAFDSPDPSILVNQWQQVICARITQEIGRRTNVALTDTTMLMVESAELAGFRNRNIIGALIERLEGKLMPLNVKKPNVGSYVALLQRYKEEKGDLPVWLLIDDIDSTFIATPQFNLKLATFFSACRKLVRDIPNLYLRASVRTDVWTSLRHQEDLDKAEQYMTDLGWSYVEMKRILAKRIIAYLERRGDTTAARYSIRNENEAKHVIELAFRSSMSWGDKAVEPILPINLLSAKRPRWMAQLCRLAGAHAAKRGRGKIGIQDIRAVMRRFGRSRLSDLHKEYGHQTTNLQSLIEVFAGGPRRYTTAEIRQRVDDYLLKKPAFQLEGRVVTDSLELCHFLYRIGFIEGQSTEDRDDWRFVSYEDRPDLLKEATNLDDGLVWSIYPSYRTVLRIR